MIRHDEAYEVVLDAATVNERVLCVAATEDTAMKIRAAIGAADRDLRARVIYRAHPVVIVESLDEWREEEQVEAVRSGWARLSADQKAAIKAFFKHEGPVPGENA